MNIIVVGLLGVLLGTMLFREPSTPESRIDCSALIVAKVQKAKSESAYSRGRADYLMALYSVRDIIAASNSTYGILNRLRANLTDTAFALNDVAQVFAGVNFLKGVEYAGPAKARIQAGFNEMTLYAYLENMAGASTCDLARLIPDRDRDSLATAQRKIAALKVLLEAP